MSKNDDDGAWFVGCLILIGWLATVVLLACAFHHYDHSWAVGALIGLAGLPFFARFVRFMVDAI